MEVQFLSYGHRVAGAKCSSEVALHNLDQWNSSCLRLRFSPEHSITRRYFVIRDNRDWVRSNRLLRLLKLLSLQLTYPDQFVVSSLPVHSVFNNCSTCSLVGFCSPRRCYEHTGHHRCAMDSQLSSSSDPTPIPSSRFPRWQSPFRKAH